MAGPPKPIVHLELHTNNLARASLFYARLCGWATQRIETEVAEKSYLALETGGEVGAGVVECATRRSLWLPYVEVSDIEAVTERARGLGATVLLDPREGPAGWRAVVTAPAVGELAFWQPKR